MLKINLLNKKSLLYFIGGFFIGLTINKFIPMERQEHNHHKLTESEKRQLRVTALDAAVSINKKEIEVDVPYSSIEVERQGSVKTLLEDADKIYHWLTKDC